MTLKKEPFFRASFEAFVLWKDSIDVNKEAFFIANDFFSSRLDSADRVSVSEWGRRWVSDRPFARAAVWLRRSWRRGRWGPDCRPARPRGPRIHPQVKGAGEEAELRRRGAEVRAGEEEEDTDRPSTEEEVRQWEELRTAPRGDPETENLWENNTISDGNFILCQSGGFTSYLSWTIVSPAQCAPAFAAAASPSACRDRQHCTYYPSCTAHRVTLMWVRWFFTINSCIQRNH